MMEKRASSVPLVGIIKEVAPTKQAQNDTVLGVDEFQKKYFAGAPLYLDEKKLFYQFLGNRKLITLGGFLKALINPFNTYNALKEIGERMRTKGIEGNMVGEGLVLGGVLVIAPDGTTLFQHQEITGTIVDLDKASKALDILELPEKN
uniref:Peroxiredoxin-like 2A n=1 Tax=Aureoumbra lagunensis TaxID=44058 RepID=A0A7S3JYT0_9STRA|mmetsp:Transcript_15165/g.20068  ORF Transcript_15165/g.20068 Transcript_15165/m.20068 type:complete len:148 (+) Transcript_15165:334-777(+)